MTEFEKAAGYLVMLKNEGYLDDEALAVTKEMFAISDEEAGKLFADYKGSEDHKESVSKNLKDKGGLLIFYLLAGACFLYISWDGDGAAFSIHTIIFWLSALSISIYLLRLLKERYEHLPVIGWIENAGAPAVILMLIFSVINIYHLASGNYLVRRANLARVNDLVLEEDCAKEASGGRKPGYNYVLKIIDNNKLYKWQSTDHFYSFNNNILPDNSLHRGDTLSIWVWNSDSKSLYTTTLFEKSNRIIDISKNNHHYLDLNKRNHLAQVNSEKITNISLLLLMISFGAFIYLQNKKNKKRII